MTIGTLDAPIYALIEKLNLPTIYEIIIREKATMVYRSLRGLVPIYPNSIFSRSFTRDIVYLRNSETDLRVPLLKMLIGRIYFHILGLMLRVTLNLKL